MMVDYEHARKTMVDNQLRTASITDRRILSAMGQVPREVFVPESRRSMAYIDDVHMFAEIAPDRALSAPAPFARLIQLASIERSDRILDVAAASGYSSAVLARLGGKVTGIENVPALASLARQNLASLGVTNAEVVETDLTKPPKGQFDVIVIEGAVDSTVPEFFFDSLADGGRMVALVQSGLTAVANLFVKSGKAVSGRAEFNSSLPSLDLAKRNEDFVF